MEEKWQKNLKTNQLNQPKKRKRSNQQNQEKTVVHHLQVVNPTNPVVAVEEKI